MAKQGCQARTITLEYPKHAYQPEEVLTFIFSNEFHERWSALGLDDEEDLYSLKLCIMVGPQDYPTVDGTDGIRRHVHNFRAHPRRKRRAIAAYYVYFEDFGIVYFVALDDEGERLIFSNEQKASFNSSISKLRRLLDQKETMH